MTAVQNWLSMAKKITHLEGVIHREVLRQESHIEILKILEKICINLEERCEIEAKKQEVKQ